MESRWHTVDGLKLHSLFAANRSSEKSVPVVLVCGLGVSSRYMIPAAMELANGFDVYCPDLPGFGKSSKPAHALNISQLSEALDGFLQANDLSRAVIVGHSFGCQIAAEFALRHSQKPERLVLAAPSGDPRVNSAFRYFGRLMLDTFLEPFSLIPLAVGDYLAAGLARGLRTVQFALEDRLEDKLQFIEMPALVLRGSSDPIVTSDWVRQAAGSLPDGKLLTIKGAAHAVNYNSPEQFARAIREFIEQS